ncbi:aspartic proteinase nepenthesin-1-like [Carex rostrata]
MNTKLLLFLVLLFFPSQSVYGAMKLSGLGRRLEIFGDIISKVNDICSLVGLITGHSCSSLFAPPRSAVSYAVNTDDPMPDVSANKFIINVSVGGGTTPQNVPLIVDITLDYTFMLCQKCTDSCSTHLPVYDPSLSDTFSNYTCLNSECPISKEYVNCSGGDCTYNYNDTVVSSEGSLVNDTLKFGTSQFPFVFGCGDVNTGNYGSSLGFLGLGSGNLSLINQGNYGKFSYCLGSSGTGIFMLGSDAQLKTSTGNKTYLLNNPRFPMLYYVNFTGVSLGGKYIDIPTNNYLLQPNGTGGMVLTSTYPLTYMETSAYHALREAFVEEMSSFSQINGSTEYGLDLCFAIPSDQQVIIPQLTLHFDGGADMYPYNYSYFGTNSNETVGCLLLLPLEGISFLGYWMQFDMQILYDVSNGNLHYEKIDCSTL